MSDRVRIRFETEDDYKEGTLILLRSGEPYDEKQPNKVIISEDQLNELIRNRIKFEYI